MRKRELQRRLDEAQARNRELTVQLVELHALQVTEREREMERAEKVRADADDRVQRIQARCDTRVDNLLGFIMKPEEAILYARSREVEQLADDDERKRGGGEFDEPTLGAAEREALAMQATREMAARGVSADDIFDAAQGS